MSDAELVALVKEWLPSLLLGVTSVLLTSLMGMLRYLWKQYCKRNKELIDAVRSLSKQFDELQVKSANEHAKIKEHVQTQRAEMHLFKKDMEPIKAGLLSIEGVLKHQGHRLDDYVKTLGQVEGKLVAIFKFIDAPKRATDL